MQIALSALFNFACLYGIGSIVLIFFKNLNNNFNEKIFIKVTLGIFITAIFSLVVNFFYPINIYVSNTLKILFFIIGIFFFINKKNKKKFLLSLFFIILVSFLLIFKSSNVVDFALYHGPYISILNHEKIIFGLANIHFRFGHASLLQETQAIFNNSLFYPNNFQTLTPVFYSTFLLLICEYLFNKKNFTENIRLYVLHFFILILLCTKIYRFNDFGNDLLPNIINLYIWTICIQLTLDFKKYNNRGLTEYIIILLSFYLFCFFLKIQFLLSILPIVFIIIFLYKKINKKEIILFSAIFLLPIIILFLAKNIIVSGCLIYPLEKSCSKKIEWTSKNDISKSNPAEISIQSEAWAKGWPQRKNINIEYKYFINNFNWLDAWLSVHFKVILNKILIPTTLMLIFLFFINFKNTKDFKFDKNLLKIFILSLFPLILWFLKFPIYRYGYSTIYLSIFLILLFFIKPNNRTISTFRRIKGLGAFFIIIFIFLNILRIFSNETISQWPYIYDTNHKKNILSKDKDFNIIIKNSPCFYTEEICTNYKLNKYLKIKKFNNYLFFYF